ncbi:hypothetical protein BOX15_Mlig007491g1 [Macrostomum lignano]|uniref:HTH OST-type domain-containing protein n=1 Tax=Macrostomum lignano TaxID=282301 RepID=A0A267G5I8_9PLAT|nr:hypothetical protein BOX15_Mlig007491g1 [Macrostomum lignano]
MATASSGHSEASATQHEYEHGSMPGCRSRNVPAAAEGSPQCKGEAFRRQQQHQNYWPLDPSSPTDSLGASSPPFGGRTELHFDDDRGDEEVQLRRNLSSVFIKRPNSFNESRGQQNPPYQQLPPHHQQRRYSFTSSKEAFRSGQQLYNSRRHFNQPQHHRNRSNSGTFADSHQRQHQRQQSAGSIDDSTPSQASPEATASSSGTGAAGAAALDSVEIQVTNLDYNIAPKEWKKILETQIGASLPVLDVAMHSLADDSVAAVVKLRSLEDARLAVSQFHRKKIGYKRIQVQLLGAGGAGGCTASQAQNRIKLDIVGLLGGVSGKQLAVTKFLELYERRYHRSLALAELYRHRDVCEVKEGPNGGRVVILNAASSASKALSADVEPVVCGIHCREGSPEYVQALDCCLLPCVLLSLRAFKHQLHKLLQQHNGVMPVGSFPACYQAEFGGLALAREPPLGGGVYLEHLLSAVPGVRVCVSAAGVKNLCWEERSGQSGPPLSDQMAQFSREVVDLVRVQPGCRLLLSKFIPAYHHHFGRQCRVADYGFTKLADLLEALPHSVHVVGSGPARMIFLTHRVQVRRFSSDLSKILKLAPAKQCLASELPYYMNRLFGRQFNIADYGVCFLEDMLEELPENSIDVSCTEGSPDLQLGLPTRVQTLAERAKTAHFALEVVDLLRQAPRCRVPFSKFIPSYHHYFARQCRVSEFGFVKLIDLLEAVSHVIEMRDELGEKFICLTLREHLRVCASHVLAMLEACPDRRLRVADFLSVYVRQYGSALNLADLGVESVPQLVAKMPTVAELWRDDAGESWVRLADRTDVKNCAYKCLLLLRDCSTGSMPLEDFLRAYRTPLNLDWVQRELSDILTVTDDPLSPGRKRVTLRPLVLFARDLSSLLQANQGRISFSQLEPDYQRYFGVPLRPSNYGYPSLASLISAVSFVCQTRGRNQRATVLLCSDFVARLAYQTAYSTEPLLSHEELLQELSRDQLRPVPSASCDLANELSPTSLSAVYQPQQPFQQPQPLHQQAQNPHAGHPSAAALLGSFISPPQNMRATELPDPRLSGGVCGSGVGATGGGGWPDFTPVKQMIRGLEMAPASLPPPPQQQQHLQQQQQTQAEDDSRDNLEQLMADLLSNKSPAAATSGAAGTSGYNRLNMRAN